MKTWENCGKISKNSDKNREKIVEIFWEISEKN